MKRIVLGGVLAVLLMGAAFETARMVWDVQEKAQLDYEEGVILWQASQVFHLQSAFHRLEQYPHMVFHYTPLYHVVVRIVTGILGDPLLSGRLVSMTAALWIVGLFGWTVLKATRGYAPAGIRWFAAACTCALALQLPAMKWVPLARVDMLGLALEFSALSLLSIGRFRLSNQVVAFFLLLLGLYTKQSLVAIPAASVLLIGLIRPSRALRLAGGLAAAGVAVFLAFAWVTDGGTIRHWIIYNVNPFRAIHAISTEGAAATNLAAVIAMGLTAFWLTIPGASRATRRNWRAKVSARLWASPLRRTGLGFGLAAAFGFVVSLTSGKEGSSINYCLDWELALCPLTGVFLVLFLRGWERQDRGMAVLRPLLILLLGATALQLGVESALACNSAIGLTSGVRTGGKRASYGREQAELVKVIATFPGPVVSENMMALLRAGKSIPFEPAIIKVTTDTGVFDESPLVKRTEEGFFDAFVLEPDLVRDHFSPRMLEAIHQNYRPYPFDGPHYLIYVRKQP
jgi:hypothetical protein